MFQRMTFSTSMMPSSWINDPETSSDSFVAFQLALAEAHRKWRSAASDSLALHARRTLSVDATTHPWLGDHRLGGVVTLPLAMAMEWFASAARMSLHDAIELRSVTVTRPVRLPYFDERPSRLHTGARPEGFGARFELRAEADSALYSALALPRSGGATVAPAIELSPSFTQPLYDGRVHAQGPGFQSIAAIEGLGRHGIAGTLTGLLAHGWKGDDWTTDPLVIDGAIQLAARWAASRIGGAWTPMVLGALRLWKIGPCARPVRCVVAGRSVSEARALCDAWIFDADGALRAEMLGIEMLRRPEA